MFRLLLGSVNHSLKFGTTSGVDCKPIPLEASCHIADHIQVRYLTWKSYYTISKKSSLQGELRMILIFQVILAGFAEQSKTSVVHMCSLFHAFILCQLWTVYLEQWIAMAPASSHGNEAILLASSILLDFWGKVTPGKYIDTVVAKYWQIVSNGIKRLYNNHRLRHIKLLVQGLQR